jgi:hypothetical protein
LFSNLGILQRQIISNIIDFGIPLLPVTYSYFQRGYELFKYLSFFELFGIVFLASSLLFYLLGKGNTIGEKIMQIDLISVKTNSKNHFINIIRIVSIAGFIFLLGSFDNFEYTLFLILLLLFAPLKFTRNGKIYFSSINNMFQIQYLPKNKSHLNKKVIE